ncbi:lipopolysaccharide heptosyltransferase family protein [Vibrio vulnificus]|uniref:glycosyltransferase family 9 protein n=1 Tax=Vibrio vulnificus TaxID=672 RepID=UPI0005050F5E|nr:glycosyltransferase family 9 protein [Vibrio vulnificus]EGR1891019.1 lipopolysaccharide heptosyltransferase family protein [Vibrio vulnificus]KFK49776.1 ADP-heptose--LPS heptosyltransferase [Vibrio vulnificus]HAT8499752.1 lipopolysaccharide heptosyltransferase family protein [Vibrio vulnificus]HDY8229521.1 glycosyltransferase family 9 protein [Vibrio vulnificus]
MKKILVIRNDKIGDFMLAWPSFAMLKQSMPEAHITALVPSYTQELARLCPWIDDVLLDPTEKAGKEATKQLVQEINSRQFDASINLFSTTYNALLVWKAGIKYRLAPATKIAQIFYNRRIKQKRSQSAKPEYQYNLDLIRAFLKEQNLSAVEPQAPFLLFDETELSVQKLKLSEQLSIEAHKPWVMVHAGTGGSANNLTLAQYAELLKGIEQDFQLIVTAGPGETEKAQQLLKEYAQLGGQGVVYDKNEGLVDFTRSIACADLFIAGSTGPLHIAATLDVPTVGFFPSKRSSTPLRWKPLNSEGRHLAFCPPKGGGEAMEADMSRIDIDAALVQLNPWVSPYLS